MGDDRIDLSALDPTRQRERFDRAIQSIQAAAGPELAARRERSDPFSQLIRFRRPMLVAAAVAAVLAATVLLRVQSPRTISPTDGIAEALGVPSVLALGVHYDRVPTFSELFTAFEEDW